MWWAPNCEEAFEWETKSPVIALGSVGAVFGVGVEPDSGDDGNKPTQLDTYQSSKVGVYLPLTQHARPQN